MADDNKKGWRLEFRALLFMDRTVVQIYKGEDIRGSFTIDKTEELEDESFWKRLFAYAAREAGEGGSN
jgi:hypothetical protein